MMFTQFELGELGEIITGKTPKKSVENNYNSNDVLFIKPDDLTKNNIKNVISSNEFVSIDGAATGRIVGKGTVLVTCIGIIGKVGIVDVEQAIFNQQINAIIPNEDIVLSKYLAYVVHSMQKQLQDKANAPIVPIINKTDFSKIKVLLPNIEYQKKVIQILDETQSIIDKRQSQITALDELTQSLFLEMFGDPYLNNFNWPVVKVSEVTQCIVPGRDKPKSFTGNVPWITISDLEKLDYTFKSKENTGLSSHEINEVKSKVIPENSVLMSCVGDLGISSINKNPVVINQQLHSFQCSEKINNYFLMNIIPYMKNYFLKVASSTTVLYMNKEKCNSIPVVLPPIGLQNEFEEKAIKIRKNKIIVEKSLIEIKSLYNSLLQKAFKGELF